MKTIYIDSSFKCHTSTAEGLTTIETDAFDGKCDAYIEGYRYICLLYTSPSPRDTR